MANWPPSPDQNRPPSQRMVISEDIAGKALDAYKSNPMLTALLILNVTMFLGFGAYLWDKEGKVAKYIYQVQSDMKELRLEAMRSATDCLRRAPQPQYILPPVEIPSHREHEYVPHPPKRPK